MFIDFEGQQYEFPDDATDSEIASALSSYVQTEQPEAEPESTWLPKGQDVLQAISGTDYLSQAVMNPKDTAISLGQGAIDLGQSVMGAANALANPAQDFIMHDMLGLDSISEGSTNELYRPEEAHGILDSARSDELKQQSAAFRDAQGWDKLEAAAENPMAIGNEIVRSLPSMAAGMGMSKAVATRIYTEAALEAGGVATAAGKIAGDAAIKAAEKTLMAVGALSEGGISAGGIAEEAQRKGKEWLDYAPEAAGAGLTTAAFGIASGKLFGDVATDLATGANTMRGGLLTKVGKGIVSEGLFEEAPQSASETAWTNAIYDRPLSEGVADAAITGGIVGGIMGGAMGGGSHIMSGNEPALNDQPESADLNLDNTIQPGTELNLGENLNVQDAEDADLANIATNIDNLLNPASPESAIQQIAATDNIDNALSAFNASVGAVQLPSAKVEPIVEQQAPQTSGYPYKMDDSQDSLTLIDNFLGTGSVLKNSFLFHPNKQKTFLSKAQKDYAETLLEITEPTQESNDATDITGTTGNDVSGITPAGNVQQGLDAASSTPGIIETPINSEGQGAATDTPQTDEQSTVVTEPLDEGNVDASDNQRQIESLDATDDSDTSENDEGILRAQEQVQAAPLPQNNNADGTETLNAAETPVFTHKLGSEWYNEPVYESEDGQDWIDAEKNTYPKNENTDVEPISPVAASVTETSSTVGRSDTGLRTGSAPIADQNGKTEFTAGRVKTIFGNTKQFADVTPETHEAVKVEGSDSLYNIVQKVANDTTENQTPAVSLDGQPNQGGDVAAAGVSTQSAGASAQGETEQIALFTDYPAAIKKQKSLGNDYSINKVDGGWTVTESALSKALRKAGLDSGKPINKANKLRKEAEKTAKEAHAMLDRIPAGQPIHSTRDRNLRDRSAEKMAKAAELYKQADELDNQSAAPDSAQPASVVNSENKDIPVMSEEEYLSANGASRQGIGDAGLHRSSNKISQKTWSKSVDAQAKKDRDLIARREELRIEYADKIAKGEIREPSQKETIIRTANGSPDNESVQAARRIAEKRGWQWDENPAVSNTESKTITPLQGEDTETWFKRAFNKTGKEVASIFKEANITSGFGAYGEFYGGDIYLRDDVNTDLLASSFPGSAVGIKDTDGHRAVVSIERYSTLIKEPGFTDRLRQANFYIGGAEETYHKEFMGGIFDKAQSKKIASDTKPDVKIDNEPISAIDGVIFENNSTVAKSREHLFQNVLKNKIIVLAIKSLGVTKISIEPPYKFGLTEQAVVNRKTKEIHISADAENPTQTVLHELGHLKYDELTDKQKEEFKEDILSSSVKYRKEAVSGYISLGLWDEVFADDYSFEHSVNPEASRMEAAEFIRQNAPNATKEREVRSTDQGKLPATAKKKATTLNDSDTLLTAIAKLGGINRESAQSEGIDPAYFNKRSGGVLPIFRKTGGKSFDSMAEALQEYGYDVTDSDGRYSGNILLDKVSQSLNQDKPFYTGAGNEAVAKIAQEEQYREEVARHSFELENLLSQTQEHDPESVAAIAQMIEQGKITPENINEYWSELNDFIADRNNASVEIGAQEVQGEELELTGQSNDEILADNKAAEQRRKQEAKAKRLADQKAEVDRNNGNEVDELLGNGRTDSLFDDEPLFSSAQATTNPHTKTSLTQAIRSALDNKFGTGWFSRLLGTDKFELISMAQAKALIGRQVKFHKVWQGSPFNHDKHDSAYIGTGEGNASFGVGHYFSESKGIAEGYRKILSAKNLLETAKDNYEESDDYLINETGLNEAEKELALALQEEEWLGFDYPFQAISEAVRHPKEWDLSERTTAAIAKLGTLYDVDLAPSQEQYLDWDKPLSEQSDFVQKAYRSINPTEQGKVIYHKLSDKFGGGKAGAKTASEYLYSLGIRGIRYKADGGKSSANNYVIFDDADIQIEAKYSKNGDILAFFNPTDGKTYFVYDNISKDTSSQSLLGLVMHEVGVHALKMGKSDGEFQALLKRFEQMKRFNPKVRDAFNRVPKDTKPEHVTEEAMAYLLESHPESSLGQRIIQAFRKLLRAIGNTLPGADRLKWVQWANSLSESDIISMATSTLRQAPDSLMFDDAAPESNNLLASFAGVNAQTADKHALATAQQRLENGDDAEQVRQDTGWFKDAKDQQWKFEIDDSKARLKIGGRNFGDALLQLSGGVTLDDILSHDALFAAYPQLRDNFIGVMSGKNAKYDPANGVITIGSDMQTRDIVSTLLHEIQHATQTGENFGKGGNPDQFNHDEIMRERAAEFNRITYEEMPALGKQYQQETNQDKKQAILDRRKYLSEKLRADSKLDPQDWAFKKYQRLSGEIEARNTQARQSLTAEQRRNTPPSVTQDIADADAIVIWNGTEMASQSEPRLAPNGKPSNLNAVQYAQVRTPEFIKWFGDWINDPENASKVVDANGEPLVVYHGSASTDITEFKITKGGGYFAESDTIANKYNDGNGFVDEYYLSSNNHLDVLDIESESILDELEQSLWDEDEANDILIGPDGRESLYELMKWGNLIYAGRDIQNKVMESLRQIGFTGVRMRDFHGGDENEIVNVIFNPNQIKSANSNNGEFSQSNNDIRFSRAPVTYADTVGKPTDDEYLANRSQKRNVVKHVANTALSFKDEAKHGIGNYLGSARTRLENISPKLGAELVKLEHGIATNGAKYTKAVVPFMTKAKLMSKDDRADLDYAMKNADGDKLDALVKKYNMRTEYDAVRAALDSLRKEAIDTGLAIGEIENYFPRVLRDAKGMLNAMGKGDAFPIFSRKIKEFASELGIRVSDLNADMKAELVNQMLEYNNNGMAGLSATKQRQFEKIPPELNEFYMPSDAAILAHIHSMVKHIEYRKFLGHVPKKVGNIRRELGRAQAGITRLSREMHEATDADIKEDLRIRRDELIGIERQLNAYVGKYLMQRDYTQNIATYIIQGIIDGEIKPSQEGDVQEILSARLHEHGTRGWVQAYQNFTYMDTMGSFTSTATQLMDFVPALYEGGWLFHFGGYKAIGRALIGKSKINREELGLQHMAQEFADPSTLAAAVDKVFKWTGMNAITKVTTEATLNAVLEKLQRQAKSNDADLQKKLLLYFGKEAASVKDDLKAGIVNDNTRLMVYSRYLDFAPAALSETPIKYQTAGNGRLFYTLKRWQLKWYDTLRREVVKEIASGEPKRVIKGLQNLSSLGLLFVALGMSSTDVKDWFLGRVTDWDDKFTTVLLNFIGLSPYITWEARREGPWKAASKQILPPFKFFDAVSNDVFDRNDIKVHPKNESFVEGMKTIDSVPVVGKWYTWHYGINKDKRKELYEIRFSKAKAELNDVKDEMEQLEGAEQRRFKVQHAKELNRITQANKVQGKLNVLKKRINEVRAKPDSRANDALIKSLEKKREKMMVDFVR